MHSDWWLQENPVSTQSNIPHHRFTFLSMASTMRSIADDGIKSKSEMRSRLTTTFNKFITGYAVGNSSYAGKTLSTCTADDITVELFQHLIAYLEDTVVKANTARVYLSAMYVFVKDTYLSVYND